MEAYQERVIAERDELAEKINNLSKFIDSQLFTSVDPNEQHRLMRQLYVMGQYLTVLNERIERFPK